MKKMDESGPEQDAEEDVSNWKGGSNRKLQKFVY
jgi:hypothetical protein